ncbi:MAG: hypothetical protein ABIR57_02350, partial [Aeromicrobium sp.]
MQHKSGKSRALLTVVAAVALVMMSPGVASADEDPVGTVVDQVQKKTIKVIQLVKPPAPATQEAVAPPPSSDSDSPGNETVDPTAPDHGSAKAVDTKIGATKLAEVGSNDASIYDDHSTTADSTLLALGGQEILGTHADSNGENVSHFGDPLAPICVNTGGAVCLQILYADAYATDDGTTSFSSSQSGIANVCVGGTNPDPNTPCTGPVHAGALNSAGQATRDQSTGQTTATSTSDVAGACVVP